MTTETTRLRVNLTITTELDYALKEKANAQKIKLRDAIHFALVDWAYEPVSMVQPHHSTHFTMLKEAA